jgi:hypothetical protein
MTIAIAMPCLPRHTACRQARVSTHSTRRLTAIAARGTPDPYGTAKGTCDRCAGEGTLPCPDCASSSVAGVVEVRQFGWLGLAFGLPVEDTRPCKCKKGNVVCWRCKGAKKLIYRQSDWR